MQNFRLALSNQGNQCLLICWHSVTKVVPADLCLNANDIKHNPAAVTNPVKTMDGGDEPPISPNKTINQIPVTEDNPVCNMFGQGQARNSHRGGANGHSPQNRSPKNSPNKSFQNRNTYQGRGGTWTPEEEEVEPEERSRELKQKKN